ILVRGIQLLVDNVSQLVSTGVIRCSILRGRCCSWPRGARDITGCRYLWSRVGSVCIGHCYQLIRRPVQKREALPEVFVLKKPSGIDGLRPAFRQGREDLGASRHRKRQVQTNGPTLLRQPPSPFVSLPSPFPPRGPFRLNLR